MASISVFGIGYVGAVSAACLARDGHQVIAVDVNPDKVAAINAGTSPIVEPGIAEIIRATVGAGRLKATTDAALAIMKSDISFVCVGTPSKSNGAIDTAYVGRVAEDIGSSLARKESFHSVAIRSTIVPGTMEGLVIPIMERASGKQAGQSFGIAYYPEFLREGSAIADYDKPGAIVFGIRDEETRLRLEEIHEKIAVAPRIMSLRTAEAIKYANNAWHATKISFANELGLLCKGLGVDSHEVMDVLISDTKLNISPAYLTPGFAFGGSCLPKDVNALRYVSKGLDLETPLLDAVMKANENQIQSAYRLVASTGKRRVGIIGLSFKPDTDDLRYSPTLELAERLIGRGYQLSIYDPIVRLSRLTGANREFLFQHLPHITDHLQENIDELMAASDVIVIANQREARECSTRLFGGDKTIIDLARVEPDKRSGGHYNGLCW